MKIWKGFFRNLFKNPTLTRATLDLLEAIAETTPTPFDDWVVARLRRSGVTQATLDRVLHERNSERTRPPGAV